MDYCPHCMTKTNAQVCPSCGKATNWQAPANQLPVGTLLRGSGDRIYQLGAAKGQGGFGITYAAMDLRSNTRVAVKEYFPSHCAGRDTMTRVICSTGQRDGFDSGLRSFLQEARTLSSVGALDSVVSVRDYFESNGTAYIVMEYVDGHALNQILTNRGRMHKQELFPILDPLLRDLAIVHRAGVIHRDISPDNLILTREGKLKLLDFGAARSTAGDKAMTVMLKSGFSPLEQYQSKGQGPYTDVYAMAGTIYYCLTGRVPPAAVDRIQVDELIAPNELGAGLSQREQDALVWGLNVYPDRRPQNVEAFANALLSGSGSQVFEAPVYHHTQTVHSQPGQPGYPQSGQPGYPQSGQPGYPQSGQPGYPQSGQPGHPQSGQPQYQPQPQGKSGIGKGLFIGIGAAVVAVALLVTGLALGGAFGGKKKDPVIREDDDDRPARVETQSPTIAVTTPPPPPATEAVEETAPPVELLMTDDGFYYYIEDGEAVIAGYEGNSIHVSFPDDLDGCRVTAVDTGCLRDNKTVQTVLLPIYCTEIRAKAFAGCPDLRRISCYSTISVDDSALDDCPRFRVLVRGEDDDISGWPISSDVRVYEMGQETGIGELSSVYVDDQGVIYGITYSSDATILDIPGNVTDLKVPEYYSSAFPVLWITEGALDHAAPDLSILMCPDMGFDPSLLNMASWDSNSVDDFSWNWFFTCIILDDINSRATDHQLVADRIAVEAAMIRARELESHYDFNIRPDGGNTPDLLNEMGLTWDKATIWDDTIDTSTEETRDQDFDEVFEGMARDFAGTHSDGDYYSAFGAALWYSETQPTIFVYGIGIVR